MLCERRNRIQRAVTNNEMTEGGLAVIPVEQSTVFPAPPFCAGRVLGFTSSIVVVGVAAVRVVSVALDAAAFVPLMTVVVTVASVVSGFMVVFFFIVFVTGSM